jgi:hypothetical protein
MTKSKETVIETQKQRNCTPESSCPIKGQIVTTNEFAAGHQRELNEPTGGRLPSNRPVGKLVQ